MANSKLLLKDTDIELRWMCSYIFIVLILLLINLLYDFHITDGGLTITILFGISSGILALLGLVAIFVSINSQHKIQKCKESYWDMLTAPRQENNPRKISESLSKALKTYSIIYQNEDKFMAKVISVCKRGIIFVTMIWASCIGLLEVKQWVDTSLLLLMTFLGIYILLLFHKILSSLTDIGFIGELKSLEDLLDVERHPEIDSLYLLATNLRIVTGSNFIENAESIFKTEEIVKVGIKF
jgi:hypothetical protein